MPLVTLDNLQHGKAVLESLRAHPTFSAFLSPDFDPAAFAAGVVIQDTGSGGQTPIGKSRAEVVVGEIAVKLGRVQDAIDRHVVQHQEQLMHSIGDLGELRENTEVLTIRSKELRRSIDKLKSEFLEPYQSTELRTRQLRRIHEANDLLKKVARFSQTMARLKKAGPAGLGLQDPHAAKGLELRELAKAAAGIVELEALLKDSKLCHLTMVHAGKGYVTDLARVVRQTGKDSFKHALKSMNQAELGPALQVFYNLECLPAMALGALHTLVAEASEATRRAFDPQGLERVSAVDQPVMVGVAGRTGSPMFGEAGSGGPSRGEMDAIAARQRRARFRDHADKWAAALYEASIKAWHLQRVLLRKVDASTNEQFLEVVLQSADFQEASAGRDSRWPAPVGSLYWRYWTDLAAAVAKLAESALKKQGSVHTVRCYPYFSMALLGVLGRLVDNTAKQRLGGGGLAAVGSKGGASSAMRALVEALDATGLRESLDEEEAGGMSMRALALPSKAEAAGAEAGATAEERDAILDALASMRDKYLSESLQRMCRPVEQMFPQIDGYQAAVPSKHDMLAFVKVISGELTGGLAEGGALLLPHLVRGAVKAGKLLCNKVESMRNSSESATKLYPLRGWPLTAEREHNLQLLGLLAVLHAAFKKLPGDLAGIMAEVGAGPGAAAAATAELEQGCQAAEELALAVFVRPYLVSVATELGGILAEMHLENYAPSEGPRVASPAMGEEECSRFVASFTDALALVKKNHLGRFPQTSPFVQRSFKWLTARLLRTYVSHAALIRPLSEKGKAKLNRDTAMVETALSGISKVSELGSAYQELRAFRELCFYGDESSPITVNGLMKERFTAALRPSTLLDFLFTRAPPELSSPHVLQRCSERTLVEELLALYHRDDPRALQALVEAAGAAEGGGAPQGPSDPRLAAEHAHWQVLQVCLDAYAQRMSAARADLAYAYDVMLNLGELALKAYGERVREAPVVQWDRLDVV